jgi:hypothetical protein
VCGRRALQRGAFMRGFVAPDTPRRPPFAALTHGVKKLATTLLP